jgi:hypothetical protein
VIVQTSSGLITVASSHVPSNMRLGSGWMLHTEHACPTFHSLLGVRNGTRPVTSSPCWSSMVRFVALDTTEHKERRHRRMKSRKGERSGRAGVVMAVAHRQCDSNSQHTYAPRAPPDHMERDHCHGVVFVLDSVVLMYSSNPLAGAANRHHHIMWLTKCSRLLLCL